ncbi:unnamed protein product, partial [marine sediment metagenome]
MPKTLIKGHRYDTLVFMLLAGWDPFDIAKAMSLPVKLVEKYGNGEGPEAFNLIYDAYREKMFRATVGANFKFIEMSPEAYTRIEGTLKSKDERLANDNAWKIINRIAPPPPVEKPGVSVNVSMSHNTQVNTQILEATGELVKTFGELKSGPAVSYEKHLKRGSEALPQAVREAMDSQAETEVLEAEVVDVPEGGPKPDDD